MIKPETPHNEAKRQDSLCGLDMLDTPAEERFDRFTRIAQRHFGVSIALVSLVDSDRQWFKSRQGLDATETPRDISFCGHAILKNGIFYISDTLDDPRFADNPLVTGPPYIRFYAGAPLRAPDGQRVGTLCIIDDKPREFTAEELSILRDLANGVEEELTRSSRVSLSKQRRIYPVAITSMILGGLLSVLLFFLAQQVEENKIGRQLQIIADERKTALAVETELLKDVMHGMLGLYAASNHVGPQEFNTFITAAFPLKQEIRAMVWIESASETEAEKLYAQAATDGYADFRIREFDDTQALHDSQPRQENYIVYHSYDRGEKDWFHQGLNLSSLPDYNMVLQQAAYSGELVSTRKHQGHARLVDKIIEFFLPVYHLKQANADAVPVKGALRGFIGMLINVSDSVEGAYKSRIQKTGGLDVYIVDADPRREPELLYFHVSRARTWSVDSLPIHKLEQGIHVSTELLFADTRWKIILRPIPGRYEIGVAATPMISLIAGLLISLLLANYLNSLQRRRVGVEQQVQQRTAELNNSREQTRAIIDTVVDGIVTINAEGLVQTFNPAAEIIFGYSADQVIDRNIKMLMPESYADEDDHYWQNYFTTDKKKANGSVGREVVGQRADGSIFPMELAVSEMLINGERMFTGIVRDISERHRAEQVFNEMNSVRQGILDSADFTIIATDIDGLIVTFNQGAQRNLGYSEHEMAGKQSPAILHDLDEVVARAGVLSKELGENIEPGFEVFVAKARLGEVDENEWTYIRKDGSRFPVLLSVTAIRGKDNEINGFLGIGLDITERKKAESDLQDHATRLRAIQDTMVDGLITFTEQATVDSVNNAAAELFGYEENELVGLTLPELLTPAESKKYITKLQNYLLTGQKTILGQRVETEGLRRDGSIVPLEFAMNEMWVSGVRYFTANVHDISERKRLDRMKSEFISTVSHELRTPLTSIRGALGLTLGKAADQLPDKVRRMLEMANRNSDRLTCLINDILDLEKIESGRMEFEFSTVDLVALARQAIADNEGYAHEHQIKLKFLPSLQQAFVHGDEHRLLQVFANLISNAVKFSAKDGTVEISVTAHEGNYRVAVRDYGRGIPEEFRQHIFQRFAQADSSDTREKGGTGLGLSITKAIVEFLEGHIDYESETDKGTVFHFELPMRQALSESEESTETSTDRRVLICEDNKDVAEILSEMLKGEGLVSDIAGTAEAARTLLGRHTYRLLLLDLSLPDMDGLQFLQALRTEPATAELPVIVVSGRAEEGRMSFKGDALAVIDWLQKPIDEGRFERALREALRSKTRPHILHVEDDPDIVQVTKVLLEDTADISHVPSLSEAREQLAAQSFDLAILDLGLVDGSGLDLLDELKGHCPVVIFSAQVPNRDICAQVSAALTKSMTSNEQLLRTIMKVLEG